MKSLPEDMIAAWLREEDNVTMTSGPPSWMSLVTALEAVGQRGIASKIKRGETIIYVYSIIDTCMPKMNRSCTNVATS